MADIQVKRFWYAISPAMLVLYIPACFAYGILMGWAVTEGHNVLLLFLYLVPCGSLAGWLGIHCYERWRDWEGDSAR